MNVDLETVRLRRLARSDAFALSIGLADGRLARNMQTVPYPYTIDDAYSLIAHVDSPVRAIVGFVNGVERLLGTCGIHHLPDVHDENEFDIGYMIFEKFWNQGVGTRAVELLIETAPKDAGIFADVMNDNPASMRVFEKLGFVKYGEGLCNSKGRGEVVPTTIFELKR